MNRTIVIFLEKYFLQNILDCWVLSVQTGTPTNQGLTALLKSSRPPFRRGSKGCPPPPSLSLSPGRRRRRRRSELKSREPWFSCTTITTTFAARTTPHYTTLNENTHSRASCK